MYNRRNVLAAYRSIAWLLFPLCIACASPPDLSPAPQGDGAWYQIFVRSFVDSDGDGIGDLPGLTARLDYLTQLGVQGIWLLPIHPSPSYHKYDVADYYEIDSVYGTMDDFRVFLDEAHARGLEVILDMVLNHTDDEHPWFQEALRGPANPYRDFYVWADSADIQTNPHQWHIQPADGPRQNASAEVFQGFFWKGMPDLHFDHPPVRDSVSKIARFWLDSLGVDGFRLDAALYLYPYYVPERDSFLNLTVEVWKDYRRRIADYAPDAFLIGEVWDGDTVTARFLDDALDACFDFSLAQEITETLRGKRNPDLMVPTLLERYKLFANYDPIFRDGIFLSNHDQNRIASVLQGDSQKLRLAASLLLTLPGTPFIYYGEEIGMRGMKPDEQIREPMIWDEPGRAAYQTTWEPLRHNGPDSTRSVATQMADSASLWHHYRRLIELRNALPVLQHGALLPWQKPDDPGWGEVLAFRRSDGESDVLVLHNLGEQPVETEILTTSSLIFPEKMGVEGSNTDLLQAGETCIYLRQR